MAKRSQTVEPLPTRRIHKSSHYAVEASTSQTPLENSARYKEEEKKDDLGSETKKKKEIEEKERRAKV